MRFQMDNLWWGTSGPQNARIAIVGEAFGSEEKAAGKPFVGASGRLLDSMLAAAGIERKDCFATNVVSAQPEGNQFWRFLQPREAHTNEKYGLHPTDDTLIHLGRLEQQLDRIRPDLILALGNVPLWMLSTDEARIKYQSSYDVNGSPVPMDGGGRLLPSGISDFRGSMLRSRQGFRLLPLIHPAAIMRDWSSHHVTVNDLVQRVPQALSNDWEPALSPRYLSEPSFQEARDYLTSTLEALESAHLRLAVDIETLKRQFITCIGLCKSSSEALTIPFFRRNSSGLESYWTVEEEKDILRLLLRVLGHKHVLIVGQNFAYDAQYIHDHWGLRIDVDFDTMAAQGLLFPGTPRDLGYLSSLHCRYHRYWKDDNKDWDLEGDLARHFRYNCEDALRTYEIAASLRNALSSAGLQSQWTFERERLRLAMDLMLRGVRQDTRERARFAGDLIRAREQREQFLLSLFPQSFVAPKSKTLWPNSSDQTKFLFYDIIGLKPQKHKKTKKDTTDDEALVQLSKENPEFRGLFTALQDLRSLGVFHKNFVKPPIDPDGRIRCYFDSTETFRWKSSRNAFGRGTNLQNIPTGDEERDLPNVRTLFLPDPGFWIFDADLSGADAQVVAQEAQDEDLIAAFKAGLKIHAFNAEAMFGERYTLGTEAQKKKFIADCKAGVHGCNYGEGVPTLAATAGWTRHEADLFRTRWFQIHPRIKDWHRRVESDLRTTRTVTNKFGYRRVYFDRIDGILPQALAWIPQSTVALTCFRGMLQVRERFGSRVPLLLQVHDSAVFQVRASDLAILPEVMDTLRNEIPYPGGLIIPWELKASPFSWGHEPSLSFSSGKWYAGSHKKGAAEIPASQLSTLSRKLAA